MIFVVSHRLKLHQVYYEYCSKLVDLLHYKKNTYLARPKTVPYNFLGRQCNSY